MSELDVRDVWGRKITTATASKRTVKGRGGPHYRVKVTAPGYLSETITMDFNPSSADRVVMLMDPAGARLAGRYAHSEHVKELMFCAAEHVGIGDMLLASDPPRVASDRAWFYCDPATLDHLDHSGAWRRDVNAGRGHSYDDGWDRIGSWRSNTYVVSIQAVLYWREAIYTINTEGYDKPAWQQPEYVVELDLDMAGLAHVGQVLGNWISGDKTDPVLMAQRLVYWWGLELPFEMKVQA